MNHDNNSKKEKNRDKNNQNKKAQTNKLTTKRNISFKKIILVLLVPIVIISLGVLILYFLWVNNNKKQNEIKPIVTISNPHNHQIINRNEEIVIHSTSFCENGIKKVELWVNGELIETKESEDSRTVTTTISKIWSPENIGNHEIIIKARTENGDPGQGSIVVKAVDKGTDTKAEITNQTDESQNQDNTTTEEENSQNTNGTLDSEDVESDESLPSDDTTESDTPEDSEDSSPPSYDYLWPSQEYNLSEYLEELFSGLHSDSEEETESEAGYRLEFTDLETENSYEDLHCYIGIGDGEPLWYPDSDGNQTTDEYFVSESGNSWNISEYLSESSGITFPRPSENYIDININCVGTIESGTDAVNLGDTVMRVGSDNWDSLIHEESLTTSSDEQLLVGYRIAPLETSSDSVDTRELDPTMTSPSNLTYDTRREELNWDYEPEEGEESIHGFAVYLNGTLQWTLRPNIKYSRLPNQWMNPPCGETYTFTVTAFRNRLPEGPESLPSNPYIVEGGEPGSEECNKEVIVSFETVETGTVTGGDSDREPGDVGPIIAIFYANRELATIDGRCNARNADMCEEFGLNHNSEYSVSELVSYYGSGYSNMLVTIPESEADTGMYPLEIGYEVVDIDRWNDNDDICSGAVHIPYNQLDSAHDFSLRSETGTDDPRCTVNVKVRPSSTSMIGSEDDWTPLPQLKVTDMTVDEDNHVQVHIRNIGTASWATKNLSLEFQDRNGENVYTTIEEGFTLDVGEEKIHENDDIDRYRQPLNLCVQLDPEDTTHELYEESGAYIREPYCRDLPDLVITDTLYHEEDNNLSIIVQNQSDGRMDRRRVNLNGTTPGRGSIFDSDWIFDLEPWESVSLAWTDVPEDVRERMRLHGYSIEIDQNTRIAETNEDNNTYEVPGRKRVKVKWLNACIPFFYINDGNARNSHGTITMEVEKITGSGTETIADWSTPELTLYEWTESGIRNDLDTTKCWRRHSWRNVDETSTEFIDVAADESIRITADGTARVGSSDYGLYEVTEDFDVAYGLNRGAPDSVEEGNYCSGTDAETNFYRWSSQANVPDDEGGRAWTTKFVICEY